jgi:surfactin synthase thioesterase subunit
MIFFLLHHAGGDKYAYNNFKSALEIHHQCIAIELPGRGDRFSETLLQDIHAASQDIFIQINKAIVGEYCIVGISMGALLTFLVTHQLVENKMQLPKHIFLASRKSIHAYKEHKPIAKLPSKDFWDGVVKYGGVSENLLQHKELLELYEPILRADFEALECFNPKERYIQLPISASIMIGNKDKITLNELTEWSAYFSQEVEVKTFEGGHFFLYENVAESIGYILDKLE